MPNVIVTDPRRTSLADVDELAEYGVATVHEALGRTGLVGTSVPRSRTALASREPPSPCCAGPATTS